MENFAWVVVVVLVLGGLAAWHKSRKGKGGSSGAEGPRQGDTRRPE